MATLSTTSHARPGLLPQPQWQLTREETAVGARVTILFTLNLCLCVSVLLSDSSWRNSVIEYAADNSKFLTDFAAAWQKLVELQPNTLVAVGTAQNGAATPTAAPAVTPTAAPAVTPTAAPATIPTAATTAAPTPAPTRRRPRGNRLAETSTEDSWEEA